ncbi:MAG: two-component system response regulator CreB [Burkholderiales bacterium]|nr:two-component system response regulator CreB [Burkholderiales bacterium]
MKPRVLIVEDEPGIADTLQYALRTEGFEPAWCATGEEALARIAAEPPALVILDVGLPDASGFEIFKRIRATSDVPVVFLTARSDEIDRVVGLELGADDYVAKPFSPRELVARVRGVLRRAGKGASAPAAAGAPAGAAPPRVLVVDEGRMQIRYHGRLLELSRYEFGLLKTLAARPGHVFSRDALLERVWGNDTESMDRTVDAHVKTVRAKMKAIAPDEEPIRTHRGSGYSLAEDLPTAT